jgi:CubicO group peptidase (beta-lactamase class C family)
MANYEHAVPNTVDTRFRVASITKKFVQAAIVKLLVQKKLSGHDTINKWLPDFPSSATITVNHLIGHTSGIRDPETFRGRLPLSQSLAEAIAEIAKQPLGNAPGEKSVYMTGNYTLLAAIIEKVTEKPYPVAMNELVYAPAGMKDTGENITTAIVPRLADGYMPNPNGSGVARSGPEDSSWKAGGGSAYSTARDVHRFFSAAYKDNLMGMDPKSVWRHSKVAGHDATDASGGMPGTNAHALYFPAEGVTVVVLSNNFAGTTQRIATDIAAIYFDEPYETPDIVPAASSAAVPAGAEGRYEVAGPGWKFTVQMRDGKPLLVYSSTRENAMIPLADGGFLLPVDWSTLRFTKDETGAVTGGTMTFPGNPVPLEFKRTK